MRLRFANLLAALAVLSAGLAAGPAAAARPAAGPPPPSAPAVNTILTQPGDGFLATSTANNLTSGGVLMAIDNLALNGTPRQGLFAINQINAYNAGTGLDNHPVGIAYSALQQKWVIFQEDGGAMGVNTAWNVFVPAQDLLLISHTSYATNTVGSRTYINSPYFNNSPGAIVFVQHAPDAPPLPAPLAPAGATVFTHNVMVTYDTVRQQWAIMTTDGFAIPPLSTFFVLRANVDSTTPFVHVTSSANHALPAATALDNPDLNDNPNAVMYVTQNHGTSLAGPGFDHRVGVQYDAPSGRWRIVTEDGAAIPNGLIYNVVVIPPKSNFFIHTATASNTVDFASRIDNPDLNFNPNARVFISHNWDPPDSDNEIFNNHPMGVGYNGIGWSIYNEDASQIVSGTTFNVYYTLPRGNAFDVAASNLNTDGGAVLTVTHPLFNQHPGLIAIAALNLNPNNAVNFRNALYTPTAGLKYDNLSQRWTVDIDPALTLPISTSFNLMAPPLSSSFIVTASVINVSGNDLYLDSPLTNGKPQSLVFATPRDNGGFDEHPIGVWYDYSAEEWSIFNEDTSKFIQTGQAFNVFVVDRRFSFLPLVRR